MPLPCLGEPQDSPSFSPGGPLVACGTGRQSPRWGAESPLSRGRGLLPDRDRRLRGGAPFYPQYRPGSLNPQRAPQLNSPPAARGALRLTPESDCGAAALGDPGPSRVPPVLTGALPVPPVPAGLGSGGASGLAGRGTRAGSGSAGSGVQVQRVQCASPAPVRGPGRGRAPAGPRGGAGRGAAGATADWSVPPVPAPSDLSGPAPI